MRKSPPGSKRAVLLFGFLFLQAKAGQVEPSDIVKDEKYLPQSPPKPAAFRGVSSGQAPVPFVSPPQKISVAIVEDSPSVRTSLERIVSSSRRCRCVSVSPDGAHALRVIPKKKPDVVLMDIGLPDVSGIECTSSLTRLLPDLQVLVLSIHRDNERIFEALEAGASGYLLKRASPDEIVRAIEEVHAGGVPMSAEIARMVVRSFRRAPTAKAGTTALTKREAEILDLLAQGHASKEIADRLGISYETVSEHLGNIYKKLHVHSRTEAVVKYLKNPAPPRET
jgi:DNA-binding NarL/FixJ family response regulator